MGRIVPEYRDGHLRELIVGSYRVVYWVSGADVLYVSFERPQGATDSELDEDGVLMRYRGNQLVGVTILNARKRIADAP
ncbi:MAG: DUF2283 domain-containing protein [Candidatus Rokubacteria bacterium]|nr:DUF2283 domain-containing protein [Candidatus Rokubacteria bacterium]